MKNRSASRFDVKNCICGRRPELNHAKTAGAHPDTFQLRAGVVCFVIITFVFYLVGWLFAVLPALFLIVFAIVAAIVKRIRGHTTWCAMRGAFLLSVAFFANVIEVLNPANWF